MYFLVCCFVYLFHWILLVHIIHYLDINLLLYFFTDYSAELLVYSFVYSFINLYICLSICLAFWLIIHSFVYSVTCFFRMWRFQKFWILCFQWMYVSPWVQKGTCSLSCIASLHPWPRIAQDPECACSMECCWVMVFLMVYITSVLSRMALVLHTVPLNINIRGQLLY